MGTPTRQLDAVTSSLASPASLKSALDAVYLVEWAAKPATFVPALRPRAPPPTEGPPGGARAVEQLRQVLVELHAVPFAMPCSSRSPGNSSTMKERWSIRRDSPRASRPPWTIFYGGPVRCARLVSRFRTRCDLRHE